MRFACILLICCLTLLNLTAAEYSTDAIELSWPENGSFLAVVNSECSLGNLRITAFDKNNHVVYPAPASYVPPNATLLLPTGGDYEKGNKLYAGGKPDALKLTGSFPNIIEIVFSGKLSADKLDMQMILNTFSEHSFDVQMDFLATEDVEVKSDGNGVELTTETAFLNIRKLKSNTNINVKHNKNKYTVTITGKGENLCKIILGTIEN